MELWELLDVRPGVTALTGGGGKTSMLYTLARELSARGTVLCATTTRVWPPRHLPVLESIDRKTMAYLRCACVGAHTPEGKLASPIQSIGALTGIADYVLVEADGSKGLPVKAHQPHEPVIPAETDRTVVLVGASAFGCPIRKVVHRAEVFCQLTQLPPEAPVTPEAVAALLRAEGLGDMVFVNQAEEALPAARRLAMGLDCPVFAGAIQRGEWQCLS